MQNQLTLASNWLPLLGSKDLWNDITICPESQFSNLGNSFDLPASTTPPPSTPSVILHQVLTIFALKSFSHPYVCLRFLSTGWLQHHFFSFLGCYNFYTVPSLLRKKKRKHKSPKLGLKSGHYFQPYRN